MSDLADYELLAQIGEGASGVVYRARHRKLDRLVALKLLRGTCRDATDQARFRQEARLAASLDHPHIVPLYEISQDPGGRFFLVMKLIEGTDLKKSADWMRCYPRKVAQVMASVARAVQHAHERGVLHRDLKTTNILMDADAQPHLIDFGLARPLEGGEALTTTGVIVGTPAYLSPEQAAGSEHLGPATDIWALGVILHELLTGALPFTGETTYAILQAIQTHPVPLAQRASSDLERICLRCLNKKPADRYASAADLAEDLERVDQGERLRHTWRERGRMIVRRWGASLATAAGVSLLVITLALLPVLRLWEFSASRTREERAFARLASLLDNPDPRAVTAITDADLERLTDNGLVHLWMTLRQGASAADYSLTHDGQITRLNLTGTQVTEASLKHLGKLKNLREMTLDRVTVTDGWLGVMIDDDLADRLAFRLIPEPIRARDHELSDPPSRGFFSETTIDKMKGLRLDLKGTRVTHVGLRHLHEWKTVEWLELRADQITEEGLRHISGLEGLHSLTLTCDGLAASGLNHLAGLKKLNDLYLHCPFSDQILEALGKVGLIHLLPIADNEGRKARNDAQVENLNLGGLPVTDAGLEHLSGLTSLSSLEISGTRVTAAGLSHLRGLRRLHRLNCTIPTSDELVKVLRKNGQLHLLRGARFEGEVRSDEAISFLQLDGRFEGDGLAHLAGLKNLRGLDLRGTTITDEGMRHLTSLENLRTLRLPEQVTPAGLRHVAGMKQLSHLEVDPRNVTNEALEVLIVNGRWGGSLGSTRVTDAGLKHLTRLTDLQSLDLRGLPVTDEGLKQLASLTTVQSLELSGTQVTPRGLKHLAGWKKLKWLQFSFPFTNEALEILRDNGHLHCLQFGIGHRTDDKRSDEGIVTFHLSHKAITDEGLKCLAGLKNLQRLDLERCAITSNGLEHLKGLTNLQSLNLKDTRVTPAGLKHVTGLKRLKVLEFSFPITDEVLEVLHPGGQLFLLQRGEGAGGLTRVWHG